MDFGGFDGDEAEALDGGEDIVGGFGLDEGFGVGINGFDVTGDGAFEFGGGAMCAAADLVFGQVGEEAFDLIDPRGRGRRVMHLPARPFGEPVADHLCLVGGGIVHDDMDVEVARRGPRRY